ncbi:serine hydrolase [bacterium]|nr:serine hydrolase [bacterium]
MATADWSKVEQAMAAASHGLDQPYSANAKPKHAFPGAVLLVSQAGEIKFLKSFGLRSLQPDLTQNAVFTVYDIASLTKPLITTTLVSMALQEGKLNLDWKVSRFLQDFGSLGKERITIRNLLNHSAGFSATLPFYRDIELASQKSQSGVLRSRAATTMMLNLISRSRIENLPGKVALYSDLGFILLGVIIEACYGGKTLDKLAYEKIIAPLKLESTGFIDLSRVGKQGYEPDTSIIAPTEKCAWRKKILCGEVHDPNAWAMGGIAGHAGIFSTAYDVNKITMELIRSYIGKSSFVNPEIIRGFWTRDTSVAKSTWALGWDTPTQGLSTSGNYFSSASVGHLAFTGCSVWIDPTRELSVILLANRIHPSAENMLIREFRPKIHDLIMEVLGYS